MGAVPQECATCVDQGIVSDAEGLWYCARHIPKKSVAPKTVEVGYPQMIEALRACNADLSTWERGFINNVAGWTGTLTDFQKSTLYTLWRAQCGEGV